MTRKTLHLVLLLALTSSLTLGVTACRDDDGSSENEPGVESSEQQADQDLADAAQFWEVVGQLTDEPMPDEGWLQTTYAPSVGEPDGGNTAVRIVQCEDTEAAAEAFAGLVGLTMGSGFNADTQEYTYRLLPGRQDGGVGTLTYRRTGGETLATVDVDIPQMPGLQQIIFRKHVANGNFNGTAYYRFGDIVVKTNADGQSDFWICVRPALGFAGRGDSHWITLSRLPSANVKTVAKTVRGQKLTHVMPKNLCTNQDHMQNLAELIYAMLFPLKWGANLSTNNGYRQLKYFKNINYTSYYDNDNDVFFSRVGYNWGDETFQMIFGLNRDEMRQELEQNGLNLIYSTATMSSNNITLPVATFSGTNLKTKRLGKKVSEWSESSFNIYDLTSRGYFGFTNSQGSYVKAWCVRYATGATLAKGSAESPVFDYYKKMPNCGDVIVYNRNVEGLDMKVETLKTTAPKVSCPPNATAQYTLRPFYQFGDVVEDENGVRWFCIQPSTYGNVAMQHQVPCNYSYFISLDRKAVGENLENIARPRNLAMQMLYDMESVFHAALNQHFYEGRQQGMIYHNIKGYAGVDLAEVFGVRDSVVVRKTNNDRELNDFVSTLFRDTDRAMCVLRFCVDYTKSNASEIREVEWRASTHYSKDWQRRMVLTDLTDQAVVDAFSDDPWVYGSWWEPFQGKKILTNTGRRTATEPIMPLSRFFYKPGEWFPWKNMAPTNMYREPIVVFAVKVVKDEGKYVSKFSDGTGFLPVKLMAEVSDDLFLEDASISSVMTEYSTYSTAVGDHAVFLNNEEIDFGMNNMPE